MPVVIFAWGFCGLNEGNKDALSPLPFRLELESTATEQPASVSAGMFFTVVTTNKGSVFVCGRGKYGRLGTGDEGDVPKLKRIQFAKDVKIAKVSAGSWHCCAVSYLGRVFSWGHNFKDCVLGRPCNSQNPSASPGLVASLASISIKQVSCGHNFTLACSVHGHVYSWGYGKYGVLGHGNEMNLSVPRRIDALAKVTVTSISAGYAHCGVLTEDGFLYTFGKGDDGALGFGSDLKNKLEPCWVHRLAHLVIVNVSCSKDDGKGHTLALSQRGEVFVWGSNTYGKLGLDGVKSRNEPVKLSKHLFQGRAVVKLCAGNVHNVAITDNGLVYSWGKWKDGILGHANFPSKIFHHKCSLPALVAHVPGDCRAIDHAYENRLFIRLDSSVDSRW
uniref:RCC1-like domain-containing protein n=1 Tax=Trichuris muris TaxID=70415 RepID=A0A5S6R5D2_TRIMR